MYWTTSNKYNVDDTVGVKLKFSFSFVLVLF